MNFHIGGLIGWRHELPNYQDLVETYGKGPFELDDFYRDPFGGLPANQAGESICVANNCPRHNQDQHCLYLVLQTKVGLCGLSANKFISLH
jgi:hypothetical protein